MKKIIIIGAGGSLAGPVIEALQNMKDVKLTLFLRNKTRLRQQYIAGSTVVEGDVMNYAVLRDAISEQDIVYLNLAGNLEAMTNNVIKAMQETGVKRIIAISSIGIYETPLRSVLQPYRKLADLIEASGLEYTILRPDWFTNADEVDYVITRKGEAEKGTAVSRKSIAAFVANVIKDPAEWKGENLGISKPN
jgi:uncharacterized protein YbjT (DUF2867 family)